MSLIELGFKPPFSRTKYRVHDCRNKTIAKLDSLATAVEVAKALNKAYPSAPEVKADTPNRRDDFIKAILTGIVANQSNAHLSWQVIAGICADAADAVIEELNEREVKP